VRRRKDYDFKEFLAALPLDNQETIHSAAQDGPDRVDTPKAFNRRHVVSREYPVPEQVRAMGEDIVRAYLQLR